MAHRVEWKRTQRQQVFKLLDTREKPCCSSFHIPHIHAQRICFSLPLLPRPALSGLRSAMWDLADKLHSWPIRPLKTLITLECKSLLWLSLNNSDAKTNNLTKHIFKGGCRLVMHAKLPFIMSMGVVKEFFIFALCRWTLYNKLTSPKPAKQLETLTASGANSPMLLGRTAWPNTPFKQQLKCDLEFVLQVMYSMVWKRGIELFH